MLTCAGTLYPLGAAEVLIGRHPSADIQFPDEEISRFHALITFANGRWQIEDIGAHNGVIVNGVGYGAAVVKKVGSASFIIQ